MDCKMENAAYSFVRIECLALQGACQSVLVLLFRLVAIPFMPFVLMVVKWSLAKGMMPWWKRTLMIPFWFFQGIVYALVSPFHFFFSMLSDTVEICRFEWENRWRTGVPKRQDGHPLDIRPPEELARDDLYTTLGVIADYNEEARRYGQGIDIDL